MVRGGACCQKPVEADKHRHYDQDDRNLADLDADVEGRERGHDCASGKSEFLQSPRKSEAVNQTEDKRDDPSLLAPALM